MRKYYPVKIAEKSADASDSIRLRFDVPDDIRDEFAFRQGQHLPVRARIGDKNVRRTYSICCGVNDNSLQIGVRVQPDGLFSGYLANDVQVGDTLEIMPPSGHFFTELDPAAGRTYAAFVAGSGITPILSIAKSTLETETNGRFFIFYGNRKRATTMFTEELWALKNRFPTRLSLHFIMSQEPGDIALYQGRIDADKVQALHNAFLQQSRPDDVFICGPNPMIDAVTETLLGLGYPAEKLHSERFRAILRDAAQVARPPRDVPKGGVEVAVLLDGHRQTFHMRGDEDSILDAAADAGLDLPYSCKGGVCSTCRALLKKGEVDMAVNYALEPWELEQGFILTCQSRPQSDSIELDYDTV
jgi:ring-1,2-phenylacetyl-CoA epoxidase subunit PaaE